MSIEIRDPALEARIKQRMEATGAASIEEALVHVLETQEEQDRWLLETRDQIDAKICRGIEQLDRGEGIAETELEEYLAKFKAKAE